MSTLRRGYILGALGIVGISNETVICQQCNNRVKAHPSIESDPFTHPALPMQTVPKGYTTTLQTLNPKDLKTIATRHTSQAPESPGKPGAFLSSSCLWAQRALGLIGVKTVQMSSGLGFRVKG